MIKYKVISDSMTPVIPVGSELLIEKIKNVESLKRFDILVFKQDEKLICHYFWHQNKFIDKGKIITRNLKDGEFDHPFDSQLILGVVTNFKISFFSKLKIITTDAWKSGLKF